MAAGPNMPTIGATRSLEVSLRLDQAQDTLAQLWAEFPDKAPRAIMRALNAAGVTTRKIALKAVTTELNVRRKDVAAKNMRLYRAKPGGPLETSVRIIGDLPSSGQAGLKARLGRIALAKFGGRWTRRAAGASYAITRGARKTVPHAFMATMPSGHVGIFIRTKWLGSSSGLHPGVAARVKRGGARKGEKFIELFGPSVPQVAERSEELTRGFNIDVSDRFAKALASQLALLLGGPRDPGAEAALTSAEASSE